MDIEKLMNEARSHATLAGGELECFKASSFIKDNLGAAVTIKPCFAGGHFYCEENNSERRFDATGVQYTELCSGAHENQIPLNALRQAGIYDEVASGVFKTKMAYGKFQNLVDKYCIAVVTEKRKPLKNWWAILKKAMGIK